MRLVALDDPRMLPALTDLDPKHWRVLSCPASGHEMDDNALAAMDADGDGQLRIRDIRNTIVWLITVLTDLRLLADGSDVLSIDQVRDDTPSGRAIRDSMRYLLSLLPENLRSVDGQPDSLNLEAVAMGQTIMADSPMSGEGIIEIKATDDPEIHALIKDMLNTVGGQETRRGSRGVSRASADAFLKACEAFAAWHARGFSDSIPREELFFLGENTETATNALLAVEAKLEEWFQLCHTFSYAPDLVKAQQNATQLSERPLAPLNADACLDLTGPFNPAWRAAMASFTTQVLNPLQHSDSAPDTPKSLTEPQWLAIRTAFAPYRNWRDGRVGSAVSKLGIGKIQRWLSIAKAAPTSPPTDNTWQRLLDLIDADCALRDQIRGVAAVERALLLKRDFWEFAHNFINFDKFYDVHDHAIFQIGVLFMDARSMHLCLSVNDINRHANIAAKAGLFVVYCRCSRKGNPVTPIIAATITSGNGESLFVGKNGLFYDRESTEWDAEIIRIIENPVNFRQAILSPFKRLGLVLATYVESLTASREKAWQGQVMAEVQQIEKVPANPSASPQANAPAATAAPVAPQPHRSTPAGIGGFIAGGGFAVAAITSSLALLSSTMANINPLYLLSAILSVIALVLLPTAILAWIRLRQRDIGKLLEANGWAVNGKIPLTRALGKILTQRGDSPLLPPTLASQISPKAKFLQKNP